ncbi:hypothetical protein CATMQ487_45520 [Sphaerotilus microaerophilus]|uniref:Uncharacterized protein n=1 Tax=Sphaerotilus microaerophilus TaxID=2914710 RepID=A0ABN6PTZ1_9BURK|nr:hypothetical protein CATMQ487_45520 [Sphaerotilus sp. FB-5]
MAGRAGGVMDIGNGICNGIPTSDGSRHPRRPASRAAPGSGQSGTSPAADRAVARIDMITIPSPSTGAGPRPR